MQYSVGKIGKVISIRFDNGEDVLEGLKKIIKDENIKFANIFILGATNETNMVTSPKNNDFPAVPNKVAFNNKIGELCGVGNIVNSKEDIYFHIHGLTGNHKEKLAGCFRDKLKAYITVEAFVYEIIMDIDVDRCLDEEIGVKLLKL